MGKLNVGSILAKAASKTESKPSKSKNPVIELPEQKTAIKDWLKAASDLKDAEARKATAEESILPAAEKARIEACRRDGKYYSSVKVEDLVTISVQNRYSPINTSDFPAIEDLFGEKASDFFSTKTEIKLTDAALNDEKIIEKLINAVGEDNFKTFFEVKQSVVPTEIFHEGSAVNAEIGKKADALKANGILKPYKAAVKQG